MPAVPGCHGAVHQPAEAVPHLADPVRESRRPLAATGRIRWTAETGSTNDEVAAAIAVPGAERAWRHLDGFGAELQTAGKGRLGRSWQVPAGAALSLSLVLRPGFPATAYSWITPMAALAVHRTLAAFGVAAQLKWPNDVLASTADGPRKVCGILAQAVPTTAGLAVVLGVGLNVSQTAAELPVATATSMYLCGATSLDRVELLRRFLAEFDTEFGQFTGEPGGLRERVTAAMSTIGSLVRAELPGGGVVVGRAAGLDGTGSLVLRTGQGAERVVSAADVVHLRLSTSSGGSDYA